MEAGDGEHGEGQDEDEQEDEAELDVRNHRHFAVVEENLQGRKTLCRLRAGVITNQRYFRFV